MNNIKNKIAAAGLVLMTLFIGSCSNSLLEETPRSSFTADYFKTADGVKSGLTALYQNLRQEYMGYYIDACEAGTDEYTFGNQNQSNSQLMDLTPGKGDLISASSSRSDVLWNAMFTNINTANGIIQYGAAAGVDPSLTAEANFFRAFDYFMLVQTFGGVPLDLGSGELQMNTSAVTTSVRNTVPEVYTKSIFPDLLTAINNLPEAGRYVENNKSGFGSTATQTLARLYLAKAYLTYAWWLQNPNNIPTYPDCDRTDPDGHDAAWYFQHAYDVATAAIANHGPFGLQPTFYDLNVASNDRNNEQLLYADHIDDYPLGYYNQGNQSYSPVAIGSPSNNACWLYTWNYTFIQNGTQIIQREQAQWGGRPWTSLATPVEVFTNTFADKTNDARYDGTFVTVYRANWNKTGSALSPIPATMPCANGLSINPGDPVLTFLNEDDPAIKYPALSGGQLTKDPSTLGLGTIVGRSDYVVGPSAISRGVYPGLWKVGFAPATDGSYGFPNGDNVRPWFIAKFSELFFIAAEAAVKGAPTQTVSGDYSNDGTAKGLINVIRTRAGKQTFSNALNQSVDVNNSDAMVAATPATIDINYILAERSREYFGEGYRWYDLVRTQTWSQIAATYSICESPATNTTDHTLVTYKRTLIDAHYYLRPIPSSQISALQMDNAAKTAYQNPGY